MNKVLRKIAEKVLLMPKVKSQVDKILLFYCRSDFSNVREDSKLYEIVRTVNKEHLDIAEFVVPGADVKAVEKLVRMVLREKIMIVEVGSWKGFTTSVLAKSVADYHGSVFAVDHWRGTEDTWNYDIAKTYDIYSVFRRNMVSLGLWDTVHPLVMDSQTASQIFADGMLDFVFIDADHRHDYIKKDILSWLPKLRNGGILYGHDCEGYYSEYPEEVRKMIDEHLGDDYVPALRCHPGVVKAVHDCFQEKYSIMPDSIVWYYIKKDTS